MLSCLARTPFKPINNDSDSDDDTDCNSDATPAGSPDRDGGRPPADRRARDVSTSTRGDCPARETRPAGTAAARE